MSRSCLCHHKKYWTGLVSELMRTSVDGCPWWKWGSKLKKVWLYIPTGQYTLWQPQGILTPWPAGCCENTLQGPNEAEQHPTFWKILRQGLDENLHAPTLKATCVATTMCASLRRVLKANAKTEDKMQSRLLLNVVIGEIQPFSSCLPAKTLLIGRDTCLESLSWCYW